MKKVSEKFSIVCDIEIYNEVFNRTRYSKYDLTSSVARLQAKRFTFQIVAPK